MVEHENFTHLSKKLNKKIKHRQIKTNNRFTRLSIDKITNNEDKNSNDESKEVKLSKPLPLVVHGKLKEHKGIVKNIRDRTKGKFHIKYGYKNTNILFENMGDFINMKKHLDVDQDFHTFTLKNEKHIILLLKG